MSRVLISQHSTKIFSIIPTTSTHSSEFPTKLSDKNRIREGHLRPSPKRNPQMATEAQINANQKNAQASTGPRTEEGKAKSSHNAMRHGLTAKAVLLPGEDVQEYEDLAEGMFLGLDPRDVPQRALCQELVDLQWRINRIPVIEARILAEDPTDVQRTHNVTIYAGRLKRQFTATLKEFTQLRKAWLAQFAEDLEKAARIHLLDISQKRPTTIHELGFDFTVYQVERYITEQQSLAEAARYHQRHGIGWTSPVQHQ